MLDCIITGGTLIHDGLEVRADLFIHEGRIIGLGQGLEFESALTIEADGEYILPGAIDLDAHWDIAAAGQLQGEHLTEATQAGLLGGVTTLAYDFPATTPPEKIVEGLRAKSKQNIAMRAAVNHETARDLSIQASRHEAVAGIRTTMRRLGVLAPLNEADLMTILQQVGDESSIFIYPQSGPLGDREQQIATSPDNAEIQRDPNRLRKALHPDYLGAVGLQMLGAMERASGARNIVAMPVTTAADIQTLARLRHSDGSGLFAATALPYLVFSTEEQEGKPGGRLPGGYPPLRSRADRLALWSAVDAGLIDAIATGASLNGDDLLGNPAYLLPALYGQGVKSNRTTLPTLISLLADNPAKLLGIYPRKGTLQVGSDADLVVFNPNATPPTPPENSPFAGLPMQGAISTVMRDGHIIAADGQVAGAIPAGNILASEKATRSK